MRKYPLFTESMGLYILYVFNETYTVYAKSRLDCSFILIITSFNYLKFYIIMYHFLSVDSN